MARGKVLWISVLILGSTFGQPLPDPTQFHDPILVRGSRSICDPCLDTLDPCPLSCHHGPCDPSVVHMGSCSQTGVNFVYGQPQGGSIVMKPGELHCPSQSSFWIRPPPPPAPEPEEPPNPSSFIFNVPTTQPQPPIVIRPPPISVPRHPPMRIQPPQVHPPPPEPIIIRPPKIIVPSPPTICFRPNPPVVFKILGSACIRNPNHDAVNILNEDIGNGSYGPSEGFEPCPCSQ